MQPDTDALTSKALQISSLIRVTAAALDSDVYRDDSGAEQVLRIADAMTVELINDLAAEPSDPSLVELTFTKWRVARGEAIALSRQSSDETPELIAAKDRAEELGEQLAASTPKTQQDAAAMLQWCVEDAYEGVWCTECQQVQKVVASYLLGSQQ